MVNLVFIWLDGTKEFIATSIQMKVGSPYFQIGSIVFWTEEDSVGETAEKNYYILFQYYIDHLH